MRSVIRLQLAHEILDMEVDGRFRNVQSGGDFLVLRSVSNQPEHFQFPGRECVIAEMLGKTRRYLRWNVSIAGMYRPDYRQQVIPGRTFQDVSRSTGTEGPVD